MQLKTLGHLSAGDHQSNGVRSRLREGRVECEAALTAESLQEGCDGNVGDRGPSHKGLLPGRSGLLVSESGLGNPCGQHD